MYLDGLFTCLLSSPRYQLSGICFVFWRLCAMGLLLTFGFATEYSCIASAERGVRFKRTAAAILGRYTSFAWYRASVISAAIELQLQKSNN